MRIAAIDIGTNSTRLLIAETADATVEKELHREAIITKLGKNVSVTRYLQKESVDHTLTVLAKYAQIALKHEVDCIKAIATSAMRDASNSQKILEEMTKTLGAVPQIIAGESEATLTYSGVLSDQEIQNMAKAFLIIDIGGGSTEIVYGDNNGPAYLKSLPLGCVRLTEMFFGFDPPTQIEITALQLHVRRLLADHFNFELDPKTICVAVAGTPTTLVAIKLGLEPYDPAQIHRSKLEINEISAILNKLSEMDLTERQKLKGLQPERADVLVAGIAILVEILVYFGFKSVTVSERDILDGLAASSLDT